MLLSRTRLWLLARLNPSLAIQFRDLKAKARSNGEAWRASQAEAEAQAETNLRLRQEADILRAQLTHAESDAALVRKSLTTAEAAVGELRRRAKESAGRVQALEAELCDERHEHAKTAKQLELAGEENRLLAAIHETDIIRRKRERAILDRERAEAETAVFVAQRSQADDVEN
ncbi:MAG TPA: hypothetical protein VGN42_22810 [Pirellulales bacterium]|jgi:septal ring factor EnvC (AmiA/AmiB activator)|nr:hypothetical protein [Pirellulales bacterium]